MTFCTLAELRRPSTVITAEIPEVALHGTIEPRPRLVSATPPRAFFCSAAGQQAAADRLYWARQISWLNMELLLIRHGLPVHIENSDGEPADPPLSDIGRVQARRMAEWLSRERIDRLYTSPMVRAMQTAEPLAEKLAITAQTSEGVAEYDRNASHYVPVERLKEIDYERWKRLMNGDIDADFHKFAHTVIGSIEDIVTANAGNRVAITCHGGVINVWTSHVLGMAPRMFFNPDYTSIHRYLCASSGERTIRVLNEAVHLRSPPPRS